MIIHESRYSLSASFSMKTFANDGPAHSSILRSKRKKKYVFGFNVQTININLFCRKDNGTFLRKTFFYFSPCVIVLELNLSGPILMTQFSTLSTP